MVNQASKQHIIHAQEAKRWTTQSRYLLQPNNLSIPKLPTLLDFLILGTDQEFLISNFQHNPIKFNKYKNTVVMNN